MIQQWLTTEFTMHDVNVGSLPTPSSKKDAIHIAVAPVKSSDRFLPGEHVGLNDKGEVAQVDNPIGIIDPFLKKAVEPGEPVWLWLYPKTVTNLRHDWSHPAFEKINVTAESEKWLREFAKKTSWSYEDVIEMVSQAFTTGSAHGGDDSTADVFNDNKDDLCKHVSAVTGKTFKQETVEEAYFSCAC